MPNSAGRKNFATASQKSEYGQKYSQFINSYVLIGFLSNLEFKERLNYYCNTCENDRNYCIVDK